MEDNALGTEDWLPSNRMPKTLFRDLIGESHGFRSIQDNALQRTSLAHLQESEELGIVANASKPDWQSGNEVPKELSIGLNPFDFPKSSYRGRLADRIAGRAGFGNLTVDTSQISTATSFSSPTTNVHSPLLTIPPGLSPAILLDSPMFLSNPLVEQLPTTVNAPSFEFSNVADTVVSNKTKDSPLEDIDLPSFAFKLPFPLFPNAEKKAALGSNHPQSLSTQGTCFHYPHQLNCQEEFPKPSAKKVDSGDALQEKGMSNAHVGMVCSPPMDDLQEGEAADLKDEPSSASLGAPSEDGYNWRKYGQKQVKGSEYPRSYYKCTQPNCQVKKKVERSHEGHITEIIYKGVHNHLKPPSNRRSAFPSSHLANEMQIDDLEHNGAGYDWKNDGLEANQSSSTVIEQCDQFSPLQAQGGVDGSSTLSNEEVEEDEQATHGSVSLGVDGDGDETESKRRKLDACALEMSAASRAVREPRVVVQTTSEIDILDDGYRWRKYGQKVVKGNPNPRSYYKCTNPGCTVRKHVERASHDLKSVITTYEGKHNHEVPAARTGGGQTTSSSATSCVIGAATPPSCLLPRRVEPPRIPDSFTRFDVHAPLGCFGYHAGHQQMGVGGHNFSFAMAQQGLSQHIAMAGLGHMTSLKVPVLPPPPAYVPMHRQGSTVGLVVPKGVPKEEGEADSGSPFSAGASAAYYPLMKMPLGPQM